MANPLYGTGVNNGASGAKNIGTTGANELSANRELWANQFDPAILGATICCAVVPRHRRQRTNAAAD
jgi:hypothetical protein